MCRWFSLWVILELNVLSFIGGIFFYFSRKTSSLIISYFLVQAISSLLLFLRISSKLFFKPLPTISLIFALRILLKLGASPLHSWIILIAGYASWSTIFLICRAQKLLPIIFLRISLREICVTILLFILASVATGRVINFSVTCLKILIVYRRVSRVGWLLLGLTLSERMWKIYLIFYVILLAFIVLEKKKNNFFFLIALAGLPPFLRFFPKILILIILEKFNNIFIIRTLVLFTVRDIFIFTKFSFFFLIKTNISAWERHSSQKISLFIVTNLICFITIIF